MIRAVGCKVEKRGIVAWRSSELPAPTITVKSWQGGRAENALGRYGPGYVLDGAGEDVTPAPGKPPYSVPSMAEVRKIEPNGLTVASLFSGCGGSSLGYRMAGYRVLYASEFVEAARSTYAANANPSTYLDGRDIREVTGADLLDKLGLDVGQLDLLDGSPPCASFSTAGNRERDWGKAKSYSDTRQRTDDLFFEYARILAAVRPRAFIAENVSGLVKGTAKGYFKEIFRALVGTGYRVEARLLNAAQLGVPQSRQRLIFAGVRDDLDRPPVLPRPFPYLYTVQDALPWIAANTPTGYAPVTHDPETGRDIRIGNYAIGRDWELLTGRADRNTRRYQSSALAVGGRPSPTVTATGGQIGAAGVMHGTQPRKFTLIELRAICGFPADFVLTGSYEQRWERLGRAVPPLMMRAIAETVRDRVLS